MECIDRSENWKFMIGRVLTLKTSIISSHNHQVEYLHHLQRIPQAPCSLSLSRHPQAATNLHFLEFFKNRSVTILFSRTNFLHLTKFPVCCLHQLYFLLFWETGIPLNGCGIHQPSWFISPPNVVGWILFTKTICSSARPYLVYGPVLK